MEQEHGSQTRPPLLIEEWLPVAELGIESRRERAVITTIPPLNWLHVWWARRPLVASAATILAGLLPAWTRDLERMVQRWIDEPGHDDELRRNVLEPRPLVTGGTPHERPDRDWYHDWFLHLIGINGDPVTARAELDAAKAAGIRLKGNGYGYKQAYRNPPSPESRALLHAILKDYWQGSLPKVLDPTAGGGSIPFESARYGLPTSACDLNPVAAAVLEAGVQAPLRYGNDITTHLEFWGEKLVSRLSARLAVTFPIPEGESVIAYIWANAVACPRTGRLVPLMPNKWLRKEKGKEAAVELVLEDADGNPLERPRFRIVNGADVNRSDADTGTVARGRGLSPYDQLVIDGDYIKEQAQAGRMTQVLYAVAVRDGAGNRVFRAPTEYDLAGIAAAEEALAERRPRWEAAGIIPTEDVPEGLKTAEPHRYGMFTWADMFTPRQLLVHGTFVEEFRRLIPEVHAALDGTTLEGGADTDMADQVLMLLGLMQGKAVNWNSRLSSWNVNHQTMRSVFDRHDFAFKWTFGEFEGASALYPWCFDRVVAAYRGISGLLDESQPVEAGTSGAERVAVACGNAADMPWVESGSVQQVCIDPPYYDNVMYAELADFFYVWEKRTLGKVKPKFFAEELTDKENEAVANPARFAAMGRRRKELANSDYEAKMTAIFTESQRVLADDGVLVVMFTHKRADAWDTLGMALIEGGFVIESSWPVNTEAEHSLHQAEKNSASSTIMLVARKRSPRDQDSQVFLDDIADEVRNEAREAMTSFQEAGIQGVDLMLATYGPALSVVSRKWPVYSSEAGEDGRDRLLRPDEALEIARAEVVQQRRARLVGRAAQIDDLTDFVLLAWDQFKARKFPYDAARLLALAVGGQDVETLVRAKILIKKAGTIELCAPAKRLRRAADPADLPGVRPDADSFGSMIDAVDTLIYVAQVDGLGPARALLDRTGLASDQKFLNAVQGLVNSMPRVRTKDGWTVPEAETLDQICSTLLPGIDRPQMHDLTKKDEQGQLFDQEH